VITGIITDYSGNNIENMDPDVINNLLDDSFDSFDDVYSSDEYLPPGTQESNHTSSDSDNISVHSIGIANDEWRYDKNSKPHIF